ncbi:hypothetical protein [Paraliobacillus salinarum]|uniref:hypothetical protein n=1 Tax=Paraliobacillus salinarum TaxID=1158996 RepID=UPI0015F637EC|nr:hypothetical protein [Paraliobacillus salinarum]
MKKVILLLFFVLIVIMIMFKSSPQPSLRGFYQSEHVEGYIIQFSFQPDENSFVEFIDNREVNKGTYQLKKDNVYQLNGDVQNIELTLNKENAFNVVIEGINNGKSIQVVNTSAIPAYFSTEFNDVEKYKELLK